MIKECKVILNNYRFTVAVYDDIKVQFPAIHRNAETVYVEKKDGKYKIVAKPKREKRVYNEETENIVVDQENKREMTSTI